jgi:hypothetical protein
MDNRNTFFNRNKPIAPQIESAEIEREPMEKAIDPMSPPPPIAAPVVATHTQPNWLSRFIGNAHILQLVLLGVVFFMGNQFGNGCQKQKQIRQQIKAIELAHRQTLNLMDSLQKASALREAQTLKQVTDFYTVLQGLNLQSAVAKEGLAKAQTKVAVARQEAIKVTTENNAAMKKQMEEGAKRESYFDLINNDSTMLQ